MCASTFRHLPAGLKLIDAIIEDPACDLLAMIGAQSQDLLIQVAGTQRR